MNTRTDTPTDACREAYDNYFHKVPALVGFDLWKRIWTKGIQSVSRRYAAAALTLSKLGYTWEGGELWKPPLGTELTAAQFVAVRFYRLNPSAALLDFRERMSRPVTHAAAARCTVPPQGWECTRTKGHDGPCAAKPASLTSMGFAELCTRFATDFTTTPPKNDFEHGVQTACARLAESVRRVASVVNPLSIGEQQALLDHPDALEILADWHDAQQAEAESIGFDSEGDKRRAAELRARSDAIVAADPDLWPNEDPETLKLQLGMYEHALLQIRKALGLSIHSEDDLLEVIKRMRVPLAERPSPPEAHFINGRGYDSLDMTIYADQCRADDQKELAQAGAELRKVRLLLDRAAIWLKSTTPDDLAKEVEDYLEETR